MGLDILLFRAATGGNPDLVRESQRRRHKDPGLVDVVIEWDEKWRELQKKTEKTRKAMGDAQKAITAKKKAKEADGEDGPIDQFTTAVEEVKPLEADALNKLTITQLLKLKAYCAEREVVTAAEAVAAEKVRDQALGQIGNIVEENVPVGSEKDEEGSNRTERTWWGNFGTEERKPLNHVDLMEKLGCMDTSERVTKMSGGRAYVLKGGLVQLQLALTNFAMQFLVSKGYEPFYPPFFMNKEVMGEVAQLDSFDDELYKVSGEGEDKYLIATSEQPIAAYHRNKWFNDLPNPIKYAGLSSCFRKEVGAHGRDTLGIFRVHQFDKVEQFIVCNPRGGESWKLLDEMIGTSEEFMKALGLPYRVVNICTGALNNAAAKKFDMECWFPGGGAYRELVSCSNCTDYQSRAVGARYGQNTRGQGAVNIKEHVHMLNGTLCALTRTMCCLCENYQTEEGILIPEILQPFMMGQKIIKFDPEIVAAQKAAAEKAAKEAEAKAAKEAAKKAKDAEKAAKKK